MYAITDKSIIKALEAQNTKTVLYDRGASLALPAWATPIKMPGLMHRKILVVDESQVFLGSANMTTQSLKMHGNLVVGLWDPKLALAIIHNISPFKGDTAEFWLLPDKDDKALSRLVQMLDAAKKTIRVAMFTFTHPTLAKALTDAKARGVDVQVAVDYYTAKGASLKTLNILKEGGIPILLSQGRELLHHKWAYIDEETLILGSANWTRAAFKRNADCFAILETLSAGQKKFMHKLWETIDLESVDLLDSAL